MEAWAIAHPWMTFWLAISAVNAISYILSPPCTGWKTLQPGCAGGQALQQLQQTQTGAAGKPPWPLFNMNIPVHNGVFHGLVRRV